VHDSLISPDGIIICAKHSFPDDGKDTRQCSIGKLNNKIIELEAKFLAVQDMLKTLMDQPGGLRKANCEAVATTLLSGRSPDQLGGIHK